MAFLIKVLTGCILTAGLIFQAQAATAQNDDDIKSTARSITVQLVVLRITGKSFADSGSGVIIKRQSNTYYVITNQHVVHNADYNLRVSIPNENPFEKPEIIEAQVAEENEKQDLALLTFNTQREYRVAALEDSGNIIKGSRAYIAGFPSASAEERKILKIIPLEITSQHPPGINQEVTYKPIQQEDRTEYGMSGGPVLDQEGRLIAIHQGLIKEGGSDAKGVAMSTIKATFPLIRFPVLSDLLLLGEFNPQTWNVNGFTSEGRTRTVPPPIRGL